jgi:hypothetical protein
MIYPSNGKYLTVAYNFILWRTIQWKIILSFVLSFVMTWLCIGDFDAYSLQDGVKVVESSQIAPGGEELGLCL